MNDQQTELTQTDVDARLRGLTEEQQHAVVCALVGHSRIITLCFGYVHCARCEQQIGDALGGAYNVKDCVLVGHDCPICRENAKTLTWKDTYRTPDPFGPEAIAKVREAAAALKKFRADLREERSRG